MERGGLAFDTAHHYGAETRARRSAGSSSGTASATEITIVGKGAHSPNCFPEVVAPQLDESLDNLRTSHVDLYLLHRDNPDVPIAEFADALHREVAAGRARTIGASNWTPCPLRGVQRPRGLHDLTPSRCSRTSCRSPRCRSPSGRAASVPTRRGTSGRRRPSSPGRPRRGDSSRAGADDDELRASWIYACERRAPGPRRTSSRAG